MALQNPSRHYSLMDGVIRYKNKIWLGHSTTLQQQVIDQMHASPLGGHSGHLVTYQRLHKLFYWPLM